MINTSTSNSNHVNSQYQFNLTNIKNKKKNKNINLVQNKFSLVHWNCNSLNNKIEEFKLFCLKYKPHIISINETKMSEFSAKYILDIDNYTTIHRARSLNQNGAGGVALVIRKDVKFSEFNKLDSLNKEICAININFNGTETCLVSYYNPPSLKIEGKVFEILKNNCKQYIIMGDLNAKSTLWGADKNNDNGDILENLMMDSDCIIVNNKQPTHINFNGKTSSVLDYCIITVNLFDAFQEYVVLNEEDMTSDHLPYLVNFKMSDRNTFKNLNFNKKANADKPKSYNYKKADWKMFKSLLPKCIIPNNENNENNVEFIDDFVCNSLIKAADQAIPIFQTSTMIENNYQNIF